MARVLVPSAIERIGQHRPASRRCDEIGDVADVGLVLGGAAIAVQHQQYRCARIGGGRPHDQEATVLAIVREADVDRCSAARKRQIAALNANYGMSRSEEHTSELQSLMRISYAVFCLKKKKETLTVKSI